VRINKRKVREMFHDEAVDPAKYHKQLDDESWFYKDQKKRYDKNKKAGKKIEYRIDPDRHKVKKEAMNFTEFLQTEEYKKFPKNKVQDKAASKPDTARGESQARKMDNARAAHTDKETKGEAKSAVKEREMDNRKKGLERRYEDSDKNMKQQKDAEKLQKDYDRRTADFVDRTPTRRTGWNTGPHDVWRPKSKRIKNTIKKPRDWYKGESGKDAGYFDEKSPFSNFINDLQDPLYEVLGKDNKIPKCPVGYKWNPMTLRCEPKTERDSVDGDKGQKMPQGQFHYNVIGSSGYDGGWAFQEKPTNTPGTPY
jgi:hypothetical protein